MKFLVLVQEFPNQFNLFFITLTLIEQDLDYLSISIKLVLIDMINKEQELEDNKEFIIFL